MDWSWKWLVDFNAGKTQPVLFNQSNNTGAIDVKTDESVLDEKSFKMLELTFSSKFDRGSYIRVNCKKMDIIIFKKCKNRSLNFWQNYFFLESYTIELIENDNSTHE